MSVAFVLLPLFVQVVLTFVVGFWLAGLRAPAVRRGEIKPRDIALREPNWPKHTLQVGHSYQNQFEIPVLFYVLTILAIVTKQADLLFVVLSWVFVLSRVAKLSFERTTIAILPWLVPLLLTLGLCTYVPETVLWLPRQFF